MKITSAGLVLILASLTAAQDVSTNTWWPFPPLFPKPLVDADAYARSIKLNNLLGHANKLLSIAKANNGHRSFGSPGHNATVDYIASKLRATGYYDVELQTFAWPFTEGSSSFVVNGTSYATHYFQYGPGGEATGTLVHVGEGCSPADFPRSVVGNIALIKRGTCNFGEKVAYAGAAGAAGTVIYNNVDGAFTGGGLGAPRPIGPYVPTAGITGLEGVALVDAINAGAEIVGTVASDVISGDRYSSNVLATTKQGDKNNVIVVGGHSDSVPAGPGINDDGSGSMGVLEMALSLPKWRVGNAVRFAFWTAEEVGLVGSEWYVSHLSEAERQKIALYLNFDMTASPNGGYFILDGDGSVYNRTGPAGSDHIESQFFKYFKSKTAITTGSANFTGRSDYGPFLEYGIPAGGVNTGSDGVKTAEQAALWGGQVGVVYDPCYHQACDGIENLDTTKWIDITKSAAHVIASYSRSLKGITRPRASSAKVVAEVARLTPQEREHYACGHEQDLA